MSTTLATLAAQITDAGIQAPAVEDMLATQIAKYQGIFGVDTSMEPDDQDLQLESVRMAAINDCNQLAVALWNAFSLAYAQGVGLSALVQLQGLQRETSTNSTVLCQVVGQNGTIIQGGVVRDANGNLWDLPDVVTIDETGTATVTATAQQPGAITAQAGSVTPYTIIAGWQTAAFLSSAVPGSPVETDAALRRRAQASTSLPAIGPLDSIMAAVANSGGVGRYQGYENNTSQTDGNGIPKNSIAVVVEGGDVTTIANIIQQKKAPGTGTYGTTSVLVYDAKGLPTIIKFFELTEQAIYVAVQIQPLNGWVTATTTLIVNAIMAAINALAIGQDVYQTWLIAAASLPGTPQASTFAIASLTLGTAPDSLSTANIPIPFNAAAQTTAANVTPQVLG